MHIHIQTHTVVSSNRRVFKQLLGGNFKFLAFSLNCLPNSGPIFANVAFGCFFRLMGGFLSSYWAGFSNFGFFLKLFAKFWTDFCKRCFWVFLSSNGRVFKQLLGGIFKFGLFPEVVCQILVRILQTLLLGVSSIGRVFINPCDICENVNHLLSLP